MQKNLKFSKSRRICRQQLKQLYQEAGWWKENDRKREKRVLSGIVRNSFCLITVFSEKELIGMGRAISDGTSDAYIQDIFVREKYRGQGIGAAIVRMLTEELKKKEIGWIGLIAKPGSENFYNKLNFSRMKDFIPMLYQND